MFIVVSFAPAIVLSNDVSRRITPAVKAVSSAIQSTVTIQSRDFSLKASGKSLKAEIKNLGCGVVVEKSGLILTNYHVIAQQKHLRVSFFDGRGFCTKVLYEDPVSDLALLKLHNKKDEEFPVISFCLPGDVFLAESVLAIGNPQGLEFSVTDGIVSSLNRVLKQDTRVIHEKLLQISAKANPGNSGGPVINLNGETLGLFLATKTQTQGIGFVLPSQKILEVLRYWLSPEVQSGAEIGFKVITELDKKSRQGRAMIVHAEKDSVNYEAGIRDGQEIVRVNGVDVNTALDFYRVLMYVKEGHFAEVQTRDGLKIQVALTKLKGLSLAKVKLGLDLEPLGRNLAKAVSIPFDQGFVLTDVHLLSSLMPKVQRGDMLFKIGDEVVVDDESLQKVVMNAPKGKKVPVIFFRVKDGEDQPFVETVNDTIVVR